MTTSITPAREDSPEAGELVPSRRGRYHVLTRYDRRILMLMVGIPLLLDIVFIWWPTLSSILLSFTNYDGVGDVGPQNFVGLKNFAFTTGLLLTVALVIVAVFATLAGASLVAKEVEDATSEIWLSVPAPRWPSVVGLQSGFLVRLAKGSALPAAYLH